jgi:hypothetical protein
MGLLDSLNKAAEEEKYAKELAASADSSNDSSENTTKSKIPVYYSEVVNLGFNCEVSFRICGYFKTLHSYMYSWIYSHDRELLLDSFDKMHDILSGEVEFLPDTNMIRCKKFNMSFHIKARRDELANSLGSLRDDACKEALEELRSRASHLADKTENLFNSPLSTLFIYKLKFTNDWEADNDYVQRMLDKLSSLYKSGRFTLLIVLEAAHAYKFTLPESEHLQIATVPNFTNLNNVQEGNTTNDGWKEIEDKFFKKVLLR